MKKITVLGLLSGVFISASWAQTTGISVDNIPTKDTQFENTVTIDEFNTLVKTLRGFYNFFSDSGARLGLNEPNPATTLTLDVGGKIGAEQYCDQNGEHCIDPATWDARPQLELNPPGATCRLAYRVRDGKYESDWQETGQGSDPVGPIAVFNSGLKANCEGEGCAVQIRLQCVPNLAVTETASCRLRYRLNHGLQSALTPWVTTEVTAGEDWAEGVWSSVVAPGGSWGNGLNLQAGLDCAEPALRCQVGYRLHNEVENPDWSQGLLTEGPGWQDGQPNQLSMDVGRACDQKVGCGLQMQSRCVGTTSTLKTALYSCPKVKEERCPSLCTGQLSLEDQCSYQKLGADDTCNLLLTENCEKVGHLVQ